MRRRMLLTGAVLAAVLLLGPVGERARPAPARAQDPSTGRVFAARHSSTSRVGVIYELTSGAAVEFARVRTAGDMGALAAWDGKLYVVTDAEDGSLWEITAGGDLTRAEPRAKGLFARTLGLNDTVRGLSFDGEGNAYILYRKSSDESPVLKVTPDGAVSELPLRYEDPRGLLVHQGVLYLAEYHTGEVIAYDLASGEERIFATGFARSRAQGVREIEVPELAVSADGRLLVLWATVQPDAIVTFCCNRPALYDITDGGDFSDVKGGLVLAPRGRDESGPDGPIAIDGAGNVYAASRVADSHVYVSRFAGDGYAPFEPLAEVPGSRGDRITGLTVLR